MSQFSFSPCGEIEGLYVVEPKVFGDERGYFMETYHYEAFKEAGLDVELYEYNNGGDLMSAMASGDLDVGVLTLWDGWSKK